MKSDRSCLHNNVHNFVFVNTFQVEYSWELKYHKVKDSACEKPHFSWKLEVSFLNMWQQEFNHFSPLQIRFQICEFWTPNELVDS